MGPPAGMEASVTRSPHVIWPYFMLGDVPFLLGKEIQTTAAGVLRAT
jgi:hypothetical protein